MLRLLKALGEVSAGNEDVITPVVTTEFCVSTGSEVISDIVPDWAVTLNDGLVGVGERPKAAFIVVYTTVALIATLLRPLSLVAPRPAMVRTGARAGGSGTTVVLATSLASKLVVCRLRTLLSRSPRVEQKRFHRL